MCVMSHKFIMSYEATIRIVEGSSSPWDYSRSEIARENVTRLACKVPDD